MVDQFVIDKPDQVLAVVHLGQLVHGNLLPVGAHIDAQQVDGNAHADDRIAFAHGRKQPGQQDAQGEGRRGLQMGFAVGAKFPEAADEQPHAEEQGNAGKIRHQHVVHVAAFVHKGFVDIEQLVIPKIDHDGNDGNQAGDDEHQVHLFAHHVAPADLRFRIAAPADHAVAEQEKKEGLEHKGQFFRPGRGNDAAVENGEKQIGREGRAKSGEAPHQPLVRRGVGFGPDAPMQQQPHKNHANQVYLSV